VLQDSSAGGGSHRRWGVTGGGVDWWRVDWWEGRLGVGVELVGANASIRTDDVSAAVSGEQTSMP